MKTLSLKEGINMIMCDLGSFSHTKVKLDIDGALKRFRISNCFIGYSSTVSDLILIEFKNKVFTVTLDHSHLTVEEQIKIDYYRNKY